MLADDKKETFLMALVFLCSEFMALFMPITIAFSGCFVLCIDKKTTNASLIGVVRLVVFKTLSMDEDLIDIGSEDIMQFDPHYGTFVLAVFAILISLCLMNLMIAAFSGSCE